jgi:hypothetical protein
VRDDVVQLAGHVATLVRHGLPEAGLGLTSGSLGRGRSFDGLHPAGPDDVADEPRRDEDHERERERLQRVAFLHEEASRHQRRHEQDGERRTSPLPGLLAGGEAREGDRRDRRPRRVEVDAADDGDDRHDREDREGRQPAEQQGEGHEERCLGLVLASERSGQPGKDEHRHDRPDVNEQIGPGTAGRTASVWRV